MDTTTKSVCLTESSRKEFQEAFTNKFGSKIKKWSIDNGTYYYIGKTPVNSEGFIDRGHGFIEVESRIFDEIEFNGEFFHIVDFCCDDLEFLEVTFEDQSGNEHFYQIDVEFEDGRVSSLDVDTEVDLSELVLDEAYSRLILGFKYLKFYMDGNEVSLAEIPKSHRNPIDSCCKILLVNEVAKMEHSDLVDKYINEERSYDPEFESDW